MSSRVLILMLGLPLMGCAGDSSPGVPQPLDRGALAADRVTPSAERWLPGRDDVGTSPDDAAVPQDQAPPTEAGCQPECTGKCGGAASGCPGVLCPQAPCAGCCDDELICRAGDAAGACGVGGGACTICGGSQICQAGGCCDNSCAGKCGGALNGCGNPCNAACPDPCAGVSCPTYSHCNNGACICDDLVCGGYNCCAPGITSCTADGKCQTSTPTCKGELDYCTPSPNNCCSGTCCNCSSFAGCSGVYVCQVPGMSCNNSCIQLC